MGGYVLVMAVFGALVAGAAGLAGATGRKVPKLALLDLVLMALGTHKLSGPSARTPSPVRCGHRSPVTRTPAAPAR